MKFQKTLTMCIARYCTCSEEDYFVHIALLNYKAWKFESSSLKKICNANCDVNLFYVEKLN